MDGLGHQAPSCVRDLVEAFQGLVGVVLAALQQVVHRHGAPVVVDVIAPLSVGEDLNPLDEARGVRGGRRQRVGAVGVHHAEGDFQAFRVDEGGAAGERDAADPGGGRREGAQGAGEILRVVACGDVAGVARLELVVQALHELILRAVTTSIFVALPLPVQRTALRRASHRRS